MHIRIQINKLGDSTEDVAITFNALAQAFACKGQHGQGLYIYIYMLVCVCVFVSVSLIFSI